MQKNLYIYKISCAVSGKAYIGWTISPEVRWRRHIRTALRGGKNAIQQAILKYGVESFSFQIIEEFIGTEKEARDKEIAWISRENTLSPNGYNMTEGGDGAIGLGRLAAVAHAKKRALDIEADRKERSERAYRTNALMDPSIRSEAAKRMWANRSPEIRRAISEKAKLQSERLSPEERSERSRRAALSGSPQERSDRARAANQARTKEQIRAATDAMQASLTPEMRSKIGKKASAAWMAKSTPEQRSASCKERWRNTTPERRAEIGRKVWETRRKNAARSVQSLE